MTTAINTEQISKHFGATRALDQIDFDVAFGEVHALVGENGAGKSTLIRILSGVHQPDLGRILVDGKKHRFAGPHDAIAAGIVTIPQELRLVPALSVAENIALGDRQRGRSSTEDACANRQVPCWHSSILSPTSILRSLACPSRSASWSQSAGPCTTSAESSSWTSRRRRWNNTKSNDCSPC
jgi:ABC-type sugar transport system ATPase subunit